MPYPLHIKKYKLISLTQAQSLIAYIQKTITLKSLPERAILCFSKNHAIPLRQKKEFQCTLPTGKLGMLIDIYQHSQQKTAVISGFGFGAPATVGCMGKLIALGVKQLFSVGIMGSLGSDLFIGEKVLCMRAFRDEGCSYHYKAPSDYVELPDTIDVLDIEKNLYTKRVSVWTTDAPFRESKEELLHFQKLGVQCVDMESSALLTVGEYYEIKVFCLGVISDQLSPESWNPAFFNKNVQQNINEILYKLLYVQLS